MRTSRWFIAAVLCGVLTASCEESKSNVFAGRVAAQAGSHQIVVTDCYRMKTAPVQVIRRPDRMTAYNWKPCRDAEIRIERDRLVVNGVAYQPLRVRDALTVDHGNVLVNGRAARKLAAK